MDQAALVGKAKQGDKEALIALVMQAKDEYYRLAYAYLRHREDALDALQDLIVILYLNIGQLRNPDAFAGWSKTILANRCRKILNERKRIIPLDNREALDLRRDMQAADEKRDIHRGLEELNPQQQEAIKLRYYLGYDYETIAWITKAPLGTVKSRISIGLARLREKLGGDYP